MDTLCVPYILSRMERHVFAWTVNSRHVCGIAQKRPAVVAYSIGGGNGAKHRVEGSAFVTFTYRVMRQAVKRHRSAFGGGALADEWGDLILANRYRCQISTKFWKEEMKVTSEAYIATAVCARHA